MKKVCGAESCDIVWDAEGNPRSGRMLGKGQEFVVCVECYEAIILRSKKLHEQTKAQETREKEPLGT